jgi:hypothetical protein
MAWWYAAVVGGMVSRMPTWALPRLCAACVIFSAHAPQGSKPCEHLFDICEWIIYCTAAAAVVAAG